MVSQSNHRVCVFGVFGETEYVYGLYWLMCSQPKTDLSSKINISVFHDIGNHMPHKIIKRD